MVNFEKIKLLVLDFDGVITNNKVYLNEEGIESVCCNRSDGLGIEMLKNKTKVEVIVISKEKNPVTLRRCEKLKIQCLNGIDQKHQILLEEIKKRNLDFKEVCFVGNDINDLECLKLVGIGVATNDAYPEVKEIANYITKKKGGEGAVREVCDLILISYSPRGNTAWSVA